MIVHCMDMPHLDYPFIHQGHMGCFQTFWLLRTVLLCLWVCKYLKPGFLFFWYIPRCEFTRSYGNSIFFQFYWNRIDIHHCESLRCRAQWLDLRILWNGDHKKLGSHPSSHIDKRERKKKDNVRNKPKSTQETKSSQNSFKRRKYKIN